MIDGRPPLRLVIADTQAVLRAGVSLFLHDNASGVLVVGEAGSAGEAAALVAERNADILVIDVAMAGAIETLKRPDLASVKTIALVDEQDTEAITDALDLIDGLVLKQSHLERLLAAIEVVGLEGRSIRRDRATNPSHVPSIDPLAFDPTRNSMPDRERKRRD
jgi:DNA-binding NarL/FixJ family response regulator